MKYLWLPWYWPTWTMFGVGWCLARLPLGLQYLVGRLIAHVFFSLVPRRKAIIQVNLLLAFPELTVVQRDEMTRKTIEEFSRSMVETLFVWFRGVHALLERVNISGLEQLRNHEFEQGTILLGAHFASLDLCGTAVSQRSPFQITYRDIKNPVANYLAVSRRRRAYEKLYLATELKTVVNELRNGKTVWFATDQDMGTRKATCFAPFFGVEASTITTPFRLARLTGARVVLMTHTRNNRERTWDVELHPIELSKLAAPDCYVADATNVNRVIEQVIRSQPAQYFWVHRRFKTMANGQRRDYRLQKSGHSTRVSHSG
ncbi:MAG: lysophospholipid acyltransferase family protein [Gammaproteobacteria bacterium]|nr:lysophospholipid acyltransferase family protein [Gammaproteobacteria bacterium]